MESGWFELLVPFRLLCRAALRLLSDLGGRSGVSAGPFSGRVLVAEPAPVPRWALSEWREGSHAAGAPGVSLTRSWPYRYEELWVWPWFSKPMVGNPGSLHFRKGLK